MSNDSITTSNPIIQAGAAVVGGFSLYIKADDRKAEREQLYFLKQAAQWLIRDIEDELRRLDGQEAGSCE